MTFTAKVSQVVDGRVGADPPARRPRSTGLAGLGGDRAYGLVSRQPVLFRSIALVEVRQVVNQ